MILLLEEKETDTVGLVLPYRPQRENKTSRREPESAIKEFVVSRGRWVAARPVPVLMEILEYLICPVKIHKDQVTRHLSK